MVGVLVATTALLVSASTALAGSRAACAATPLGAHCMALVQTTAHGADATFARPSLLALGTVPYGPGDFHAGYALPTTGPAGQTIGIVDAFNDPNAESDLAVYSTNYGLPACTTANGCFRKVNQTGGTSYPANDTGWSLEISLDVQVAHAICQNCKILLVEATNNSFANLAIAVDEAVSLGATVVSNSYGGGEFGGSTADYNHPHVAITASTGDDGFAAGTQFPASSPTVIAVGGTSLHLLSGGAYGSESAWNGAGSGCSSFYSAQPWQASYKNFNKMCAGGARGIADVSAVADPNTGAAVYDSFGEPGWLQVGGTSLSSPLIASVYALAGNAATVSYPSQITYATLKKKKHLHDVTTGNNGSCGNKPICTAKKGIDGPTGLGTPLGLGAF